MMIGRAMVATMAAEHPLESVPPQRRASGAEIAPLVDGADGAAEPTDEDAEKRAEHEVAEAEELMRQWERGKCDEAPFDLTVMSMIGGKDAAFTLEGVSSKLSVAQLHKRIALEMESKPHPDQQRLFIVNGGKGPLSDETLPIGAYGVVAGVTLHLAMCDGQAAAARRLLRVRVRAAQAAARARTAEEAEREAERREKRREERRRKTKWAAKLLSASVVVVLVVMIIAYFHSGCGACENDAACDGLFGECVCTGNHLGEYCEDSCGELGQVNGGACVCSGNRTGAFCELDLNGMILRSEYNDATVGAVTYRGATQALTWQLQHELCIDAGKATPGSSARACPELKAGTDRVCASQKCSFSSHDDVVHDNHVVAGTCNTLSANTRVHLQHLNSSVGWSGQMFRHVSGSLEGGVGYMCAGIGCKDRVRVEGTTVRGESSNERASLRDGDAVFCSTCQVTDDACCGVNCGGEGQCSDGVCSCKEGADNGPGIWFGPSVCGGFCEEIDDEARSPIGTAIFKVFMLFLIFVLSMTGAGIGTACVGECILMIGECILKLISCGRLDLEDCIFPSFQTLICLMLCEAVPCIVLTIWFVGCMSA
eukprot:COSAG02_NODE_157_length_32999_cov_31.863647_27_plen_596_part_00